MNIFTYFRKRFGLAPYNRPTPTVEDLEGTFRSVSVAAPAFTVAKTENGRWAIYDVDRVPVRSYSTRSNAIRGLARLNG